MVDTLVSTNLKAPGTLRDPAGTPSLQFEASNMQASRGRGKQGNWPETRWLRQAPVGGVEYFPQSITIYNIIHRENGGVSIHLFPPEELC